MAAELAAELGGYVDGGATAVINATGVIIHTNLGRAPWPTAAIEAARAAAAEPLLLELDRVSGRRGARFRLAEEHLIALTGAEDALVTNNNAAAVALAVGLAGRRGGVAVSRGELVEIGGGVRIPEIVRRAGARLIEVGTTNRTRVADFEAALTDGSARLVLRVHPSNFVQEGFVEAPDPLALAELAHRHGALVIDDLGSGALLPTERFGLAHEPMPSERLAAGSDIVTFSGDKLVGGPQAGLVVGRADLIARIRRDPFARAMRPDKTTLAALAATLGLYRAGRAEAEIPVWQMLAQRPDDLRARADASRGRGPGRQRHRRRWPPSAEAHCPARRSRPGASRSARERAWTRCSPGCVAETQRWWDASPTAGSCWTCARCRRRETAIWPGRSRGRSERPASPRSPGPSDVPVEVGVDSVG